MTAFGGSGVLKFCSCASIINATTPLVTAAAMLVPLSMRYRGRLSLPKTRPFGRSTYSVLRRAAAATSRWPGATTSGLAAPSNQVGPRELYNAIRSSRRDAVFLVSTAPTVIAEGALPGDVMPA